MMTLLHLVRHGRAAAGYGDDPDPGLDDQGRLEAEAVADSLASLGPLPVLVSPLKRCRETAAPLEARWGRTALVEPSIAEVAAPVSDFAGRSQWLRRAMGGTWAELEDEPRQWRQDLVDRLLRIDTDTVLFTHFVAINAVIGWANDDDRVLIDHVANGSVTVVELDGAVLHVVQSGAAGRSEVL